MCGVAGFLRGQWPGDQARAHIQGMTDAVIRRGPDSQGLWQDADGGIALGHRRLAIIDLSPAGAQPMHSASGRYVVAFNGEIYNHLDLRKQLEKAGQLDEAWRGHSDTESLLAGFDTWGIQATVERAVGMFAFAAWDRKTRTLTLGRDRLGEKPMYYGWQGSGESAVFLFGSELKALRAHPAFRAPIDRDALCLYMRHANVVGAHCIYQGIRKLLPGSLLEVSLERREPAIRAYWSGLAVAAHGVAHPFQGTTIEAIDSLEDLLKAAVLQQMVADAPLGVFLSGGVDSSTIVSLMQAQSSRPVRTFTVGFHEDAYNEAKYAKEVARHLGTDHTELYVTPEQAMAVIPRLSRLYDEPFADSSQISTFLVSELARQHVTVSLSGDAGDELFCGYNRYQLTEGLWRRLSAIPLSIRRTLAWALTRFSPASLSHFAAWTGLASDWAGVGEKLHKGASVMDSTTVGELYLGMVSQWTKPEELVRGGSEPATLLTDGDATLAGMGDVERMMALDMLTYLPDDILTKVDRAAMGVSLESRVPYLDHRVVEFAWRLPLGYKLRKENGAYTTKWALRQVLYRYVPRLLIDRPKMGFGVPIDSWLRGPLRDWAEDLLDERRLAGEGFLNAAPIRGKWAEHLGGRRNWQHPLWCVLMFQAWLKEQSTPRPGDA